MMPRMDKLSNYCTTVVQQKGVLYVTYVSTVIVEAGPDEIVLRTGGWRSATTKNKMNQAANQFNLPYGVFQKDHDWFVRYKGQTLPFDGNEMVLER